MASLITVQEYKDFANVTTTKTDDQLQIMCDTASNIVETYLNRKFDGAAYILREKISENRYKVFLRDYDNEVGSVMLTLNDSEHNTVILSEEDGNMYLDDYLGIIEVIPNPNTLPKIPDGSIITVSVTNPGAASVPPDVKLATYMLVTYYKENHYNKDTVQSMGGQQVTFAPSPKNLPNYVRAILTPHRID